MTQTILNIINTRLDIIEAKLDAIMEVTNRIDVNEWEIVDGSDEEYSDEYEKYLDDENESQAK
jgi:hypothetical protein